jgi:hypothetical protein
MKRFEIEYRLQTVVSVCFFLTHATYVGTNCPHLISFHFVKIKLHVRLIELKPIG